MPMKPTYESFKSLQSLIVEDMRLLSGDVAADPGTTWQDIAGTLATNLRVYAKLLHDARDGLGGPFLTFPSIDETVGGDRDGQC
jgi:hypothetical protein